MSDVTVTHDLRDGISIIKIKGPLTTETLSTINANSTEIFEDIKNNFSAPGCIIDCHEVTFIDSTGIGWLNGKHIGMKKRDKTLYIVDTSAYVDKALHAVGVLKFLNVDTLKNALRALQDKKS
ncbi:MAG: STAS domain-containing protein [SAR324 cluster bacterium]|nr:STAS domain-containing protein [SAR324 cluster bacterium]